MTDDPASYPRHRLPAEIISHAVWLYHVFGLSLRDVELILAERGVLVTHESIRPGAPGTSTKCSSASGPLPVRTVDQHGVVLDPMRVDGGRGQGPLATLDQDLRTAAPALNIELLVA